MVIVSPQTNGPREVGPNFKDIYSRRIDTGLECL